MNRSNWKGPYFDTNTLKNLSLTLNKKKLTKIFNIERKSTIVPKFVGLTFTVHSGKELKELVISKEMVGHKFGAFIPTRAKYVFKKKKKKKK